MATTTSKVGTCNIPNRTIFEGDNLDVMRGMNDECVDLIYLDPPFNSNRDYAAPIGSKAAGAAFKDTWDLTDVDEAWHNEIAETDLALYKIIDASEHSHGSGMKSYLIMMAVRLLEMRRILKPTGSLYLHCDPTASHYIKLFMDAIFGYGSFRSEVIWQRTSAHPSARRWASTYDSLLFYTKSEKYKWNRIYQAPDKNYVRTHYIYEDDTGRYRAADLTGAGVSRGASGQIWRGFDPNEKGRHWAYVPATLDEMDKEGLIHWPKKRTGWPAKKVYWDDTRRGRPVHSVWTDIPPINSQARERLGYPTQKPLALLDRIIQASSDPGDVVLDPFCGCATTCIAAERLDRQWIGIDLSELAVKLVEQRARNELGLLGGVQAIARSDIPKRTDREPAPPLSESKVVLYGTQGGNCNGCGTHFLPQHLTVDHIIARSKGGTDHLNNLQLLCGHCNSLKGDRPMEYLRARLVREYV